MYVYISLRSDAEYTAMLPVRYLQKILDQEFNLIQDEHDPRSYRNREGLPWLNVSIINCDVHGNYPAGLRQDLPEANLVVFTTAYYSKGHYWRMAQLLSAKLAWEMIQEQG